MKSKKEKPKRSCRKCGGQGRVVHDGFNFQTCPDCKGRGQV